ASDGFLDEPAEARCHRACVAPTCVARLGVVLVVVAGDRLDDVLADGFGLVAPGPPKKATSPRPLVGVLRGLASGVHLRLLNDGAICTRAAGAAVGEVTVDGRRRRDRLQAL